LKNVFHKRDYKLNHKRHVLDRKVVLDGEAVSASACHAGSPGSIPSPGQTYEEEIQGAEKTEKGSRDIKTVKTKLFLIVYLHHLKNAQTNHFFFFL
jgi:hypothetical protein